MIFATEEEWGSWEKHMSNLSFWRGVSYALGYALVFPSYLSELSEKLDENVIVNKIGSAAPSTEELKRAELEENIRAAKSQLDHARLRASEASVRVSACEVELKELIAKQQEEE